MKPRRMSPNVLYVGDVIPAVVGGRAWYGELQRITSVHPCLQWEPAR